MTYKDPTNKNLPVFMNNGLIDENYNNIVLAKIAKELQVKNSISNNIFSETNEGELTQPEVKNNYVLVKCKGFLGIHFCENPKNLCIKINDRIIVKLDNEIEFASVIEIGEMVNLKKEKLDADKKVFPIIERTASEYDIEKHISNVAHSHEAKSIFIKLVEELELEMKLVDIHYQFDKKKLFFFYTADGRIDFRELAKKLASTFKTRIELRQIGVRDEAKRLGGIATCGREYCCSSFLNNFKRITTDIATENNISTSISKYTGPCGKLKCCLSFEV